VKLACERASVTQSIPTKDNWKNGRKASSRTRWLITTWASVRALAVIYFNQKDYENWEQTYVDFLERGAAGLTGAQVHIALADGLIVRDMYQKALPHVRIAAQTHSSWGMISASELTEKLALWKESEQWIQAVSTSYPSSRWHYWYLWCRRNGRGDLAAARKVAAKAEARSSKEYRNQLQWTQTAVFRLMEDDVLSCHES